jgi:hypothetical protein
VLKRDGGFVTQDSVKIAGREDAKKMKNMRQPDRPDVQRGTTFHQFTIVGLGSSSRTIFSRFGSRYQKSFPNNSSKVRQVRTYVPM